MSKIRELPPDLVDKIAAGEVVERPASVVKELLENALDAGARRVEVTVEEGGLRLVRVTDDGEGMTPDELPLAVRSHATSKIRTVDDLFAIRSLGFRGEALASIAAVSHLRVASRPRDARGGAELRVSGGRMGEVAPAGLPPGTTIEAADLFFNVPARRAFVSTSRAELRAVTVEVRRQALARPEVTLRLVADGQAVIDAPATDEPRERLAQLLGRDLAEDLIAVPRAEEEAGTLRGYVSPCDRSRGDSQQQFFFLNGRTVRDPTLLSAVRQAYANLLPPRRHPTALLWLDVDPADVDVNVHPQKADVRFRRDREVFHLIVRAVRAALQRGGMVAELHLARRPTPALAAVAPAPRASRPAPSPWRSPQRRRRRGCRRVGAAGRPGAAPRPAGRRPRAAGPFPAGPPPLRPRGDAPGAAPPRPARAARADPLRGDPRAPRRRPAREPALPLPAGGRRRPAPARRARGAPGRPRGAGLRGGALRARRAGRPRRAAAPRRRARPRRARRAPRRARGARSARRGRRPPARHRRGARLQGGRQVRPGAHGRRGRGAPAPARRGEERPLLPARAAHRAHAHARRARPALRPAGARLISAGPPRAARR
ncbi:MAG: DNA mismatch repair endonuclease MutL [Planctomycetes bacterium]|nr:DNA mismatch repair endonuclease MutL [Planctomycetota bacterium]